MKLHNSFVYIVNDILITYFDNYESNQIYTYFRIFYILKVIVKYVMKEIIEQTKLKEMLIDDLKNVKNKNIDKVMQTFTDHYDFFYKTFFIDDNIHFNTHFNNLLMYFYPFPYEFILYSPLITYRKDVTKFYKKNDYNYILLDNIDFDKIPVRSFVQKKNMDVPKYEIDIHLNTKYYDFNLFKNDDVIYYVALNDCTLICKIIKQNGHKLTLDVMYRRPKYAYNIEHYKAGLPFELIAPKWFKYTEKIIEVQLNEILYMGVHKKFTKKDLFNVFGSIDFTIDRYKYLYHDTDNQTLDLTKATYFYLTPLSKLKFDTPRKCVIGELIADLKGIINFTDSVVANNAMTQKQRENDMVDKKWISYNNVDTLEFYNGVEPKNLKQSHSNNNACVTSQYDDINEFIKVRPYCDTNKKSKYTGRRKIHEILFKTRKHDPSRIYVYKYAAEVYKNFGFDLTKNDMYYPKINLVNMVYDNILNDVLIQLGIPGFFFTDYDMGFNIGGELLITNPIEYVQIFNISTEMCHTPTKLKKMSRDIPPKYAYVMLLMKTSLYFYGAMVTGYSLKKQNSKYDTIIMVTPDVSSYQKNMLKKVYDIVMEIDYTKINTSVIANYETTRFRDVFTKLEALKLVQYDKIIMMDIDMCVIKNMDELFDLEPPCAVLRHKILKHGEKINTSYIYRKGKFVAGINAGIMLLKPSIKEYNDIINDLQKDGETYKNPEQDYLSLRYNGKWTNISFSYNFQFGFDERVDKFKKLEDESIEIENTAPFVGSDAEIHNLHFSSRTKPWSLIYNKEYMSHKIKKVNERYYDIWMQHLNEINKKYDILPNYLKSSGSVTNTINNNLKHITLSKNIKFIGNRSQFVTDIDIVNNVSSKTINAIDLQKLVKYLPEHISFVFLTYGRYFDVDKIIQIDWLSNDNPKITVRITKDDFVKLLKTTNIADDTMNYILELFDRDVIKCYSELKQISKKKVHLHDLNTITQFNENEKIIAHYAIKYDSTYLFVDVAYVPQGYIDNYVQSESSNGLGYYFKEYYYILSSLKKYFDAETVTKINYLLKNEFGMFIQINIQLIYLNIYSRFNVLSSSDFIKYFTYVILVIEKSIYNTSDKDSLLTTAKKNIILIDGNKIKVNDASVYYNIKQISVDIFKWLNSTFYDPVSYYLSLIKQKPKYAKLLKSL